MKCQVCGSQQTRCLDSRLRGTKRRRRYECNDCGGRFTTVEVPENWIRDRATTAREELLRALHEISSLTE